MTQNQFKLSAIFWITAVACLILSVAVYPDSIFSRIFSVVFAANVLGAIAALFITFGCGFPRDGSYRHGEEEFFEQD